MPQALGLYGEIEDVSKGLESGEISTHEITFFLGYTGWEKSQLADEINDGSWIPHNIDLNTLQKNINWSNLLIQIIQDVEKMHYHLSLF